MMRILTLFLLVLAAGCTKDPAPPASTPYVRTSTTLSSLTRISAISGGNVVNDYGAEVKQRGLCWSTGTNPTIYNSYTINGSGTGSFSSQLTGLIPARTYYIRAYAINDVGLSYGQTMFFTTPN
jgi:hypothetical protein